MKRLTKIAIEALMTVALAPLWFAYLLSAACLGRARVFSGYSQLMSLAPGLFGQYLRRCFYRLVLPRCGSDACIQFGSVFSHSSARIENRVYVGPYCILGDVTLESDVLLGSHVSVINGNGQHGIDRLDVPVREQRGIYPRVTIGQDSWIGDRSIVMVDVGRHAVVGAGSVVTKPVPDYAIVAGNPARLVGSRLTRSALNTDRPADSLATPQLNGSR